MSDLFINCLKSDKIESGACHGQFLIDSLKPGQGITLGNHLRRVLLNDLSGVAISAVRIAGVNNEFASISGIREDILEILLNLKGIVLKAKNSDKKITFGKLKIEGPAVVTADLIELPPELEVINLNHYIMTISTLKKVEIEFKFEHGVGYKLASQSFSEKFENYLELDKIFMPVQKVDFQIKNIYNKKNQISEQLLLNIWTNGSVLPIEALNSAAQITIDLFKSLLENKNPEKVSETGINKKSKTIKPYKNIAIEELQLSVRAYNCLKKANINTVGDLLHYSPEALQGLKNFGRKSSEEVFSTLKNKLGILLK